MPKEATEWLFNQAPSVVILIIIIVVGYKQVVKFIAKQNKSIAEAWAAKEKESDKRFDDMKDRFNSSDRRHDQCEDEKKRFQEQLFQLALMTGNTEIIKPKTFKNTDEKLPLNPSNQ